MNKKYKAQALAIAMIVLVVCSIIGMSIYSRVTKDKSLTIEEQASSEALEISDILIDYLIQIPIEEVVTQYDKQSPSNGESLTETTSEISNYLSTLNIDGLTSTSICSVEEGNGNEYYLKVEEADENTFFEIRPGQVKSFVVKDLTLGEDCKATAQLTVRGEDKTGFSVSRIYSSATGDIKEYEMTDTTNYRFSDNTNFTGDGWIQFEIDGTLEIELTGSTTYETETYTLDEVRVKAIGGTVAIAQSLDTACDIEGLRMIQITAGANCNGVYRAKQIIIPERKWSSTIFDYVIFNGEGSI